LVLGDAAISLEGGPNLLLWLVVQERGQISKASYVKKVVSGLGKGVIGIQGERSFAMGIGI
jgi:hypothetical protein